MRKNRVLLLVIALVCLSSCSNFQPLYKKNSHVEKALSDIEIEPIDTIQGAELYHHLTKLIGHSDEPKYTLQVKLVQDKTAPMAITREAAVIKQNVTQLYYYSLSDKITGKVLDQGRLRISSSYNAVSTPYASYTQERYTKKNLTQTAAEDLYLRLMMYFAK